MSIRNHIYKPRRHWSHTDMDWLKANYNFLSIEACMSHLNRDAHSIYNKAGRLGIDGKVIPNDRDEVSRRRRLVAHARWLCEEGFRIAQEMRSEKS